MSYTVHIWEMESTFSVLLHNLQWISKHTEHITCTDGGLEEHDGGTLLGGRT